MDFTILQIFCNKVVKNFVSHSGFIFKDYHCGKDYLPSLLLSTLYQTQFCFCYLEWVKKGGMVHLTAALSFLAFTPSFSKLTADKRLWVRTQKVREMCRKVRGVCSGIKKIKKGGPHAVCAVFRAQLIFAPNRSRRSDECYPSVFLLSRPVFESPQQTNNYEFGLRKLGKCEGGLGEYVQV